jgi:hypothetical protein
MAEQMVKAKDCSRLTSVPGIHDKSFLVLDETEAHGVCYYQGYAQQIRILLRRSEGVGSVGEEQLRTIMTRLKAP